MSADPTECRARALIALVLVVATKSAAATSRTVVVSNVAALQGAVATTDKAGGHTRIILEPGTYELTNTLDVTAPNVSLEGRPGDGLHTIVRGDGMSPSARVGTLVRVTAAHFELGDLTLERSRFHLIQIAGEKGASAPIIRDCILRDSYEQMIKISVSGAHAQTTSNYGTIDNCLFEYTAGIGPQYYIGGIDAHGAKRWIVRGNVFRNIASPRGSVAEFAIHFWDGSADNTVERNYIVNCDRGIGFGLASGPNYGGIIRNNVIFHSANSAPFSDVGIALISSPNTQVYNNTVFFYDSYPNGIEYSFPGSNGLLIANNLLNRAISGRGGATGSILGNVTTARPEWFVNAQTGDLHLAFAVPRVVKAGIPIPHLIDDVDGRERSRTAKPDVGAHEITHVEGALGD